MAPVNSASIQKVSAQTLCPIFLMAAVVDYEKQTVNHPNPLARFAHRSRMARSLRVVRKWILETAPDERLIDYGAGQGRFLQLLSLEIPAARHPQLIAYEPFMETRLWANSIKSKQEIPDDSISIITSLEVCEHLDREATEEFLAFIKRKLRPKGRCLISVPIMSGPALIAKELSRMLLFRRRSDHSFGEIIKHSLCGGYPSRAKNILTSHRGYNWHETLSIIQREFGSVEVSFGPLPLLGWYGNSQAYLAFRKAV